MGAACSPRLVRISHKFANLRHANAYQEYHQDVYRKNYECPPTGQPNGTEHTRILTRM